MLHHRSSLFAVVLLLILAPSALAHEAEPCVDGMAAVYPCSGVDLAHRLHIDQLGGTGGTEGSDIWGWTDSASGREFALVGLTDQTAFVEITDPTAPVYLGSLPTSASNVNVWRDVKTYADHAFIVADSVTGHGMQVFDLTQLLTVDTPPETFTETALYSAFDRAHNIVINEDSATAYAVGTETCGGGLHVIDISDPTNPFSADPADVDDYWCVALDGYTHDAQCVTYAGPDADYTGQEICVGFNADTVTVFDVTDRENPIQVSRTPYVGAGYTHQGWFTEDQAYVLLNDETDELNFGHNTKTYVWNMSDLDAPFVIDAYVAAAPATDHNLYVLDNYVFEANYRSGLRILQMADLPAGQLEEVAYFDTYPSSDSSGYAGAWSVYPYFPSRTAVVSDIQGGLFVLTPTALCEDFAGVSDLAATAAGDQQIQLTWTDTLGPGETYAVYRALGTCGGTAPDDYGLVAEGLTSPSYLDTGVSGSLDYAYDVRKVNDEGCPSLPSGCAGAATTGACVESATFDGLATVSDLGSSTCQLQLSWSAAQPICGSGVTYSVYRSESPDPVPGAGNRVAEGVTGTSWIDTGVVHDQDYYYVVRARDTSNAVEDDNLLDRAGSPTGPPTDGSWITGAEVGDPVLITDSGNSAGFAKHAGWHLSDSRAHAGSRSYFSQYSSNLCAAVSSPPMTLTPAESSQLSFWTVYDIEDDSNGDAWDGGVVEISVEGAPWQRLDLTPDYPKVWRSSSDACGYDTGSPTFSGTNLAWTEHTVDLSPWAGQQVEIAWRFSTDGAVTQEGWYVDDIEITHAQIPGVCGNDPNVFSDDFESGDLSAWSSATP